MFVDCRGVQAYARIMSVSMSTVVFYEHILEEFRKFRHDKLVEPFRVSCFIRRVPVDLIMSIKGRKQRLQEPSR